MGIRIVALNKSPLPGIYCSDFHTRVLFKPQCHQGSENQRKLRDVFLQPSWRFEKITRCECLPASPENSSIIHSLSPQTTKYSCACLFVVFF